MTKPDFGCFSIADAIQITRGRLFAPLDPYHPANDYDIDYIAHSLALQCRWMGGTNDLVTGDPVFYSVAQHSCHVADLTGLFFGLMHDASEAYLCDIPRPLKPRLGGYYEYESDLMDVICAAHCVERDPVIIAAIKDIDNKMIYWERDALIGKPSEPYANEAADHPGTTILDVIHGFEPWSPKRAKEEFLGRYHDFLKAA